MPTMYVVRRSDTLERVAAAHDVTPSALMKFNRMQSRMIFEGQQLYIPSPDEQHTSTKVPPKNHNRTPSHHAEHEPPAPGDAADPAAPELDAECLQKFVKLKVKQFTDNDGVVSGTLLITPNCLMFDPDVNHPLVKEFGADGYGMVAPMDQVMSVGLFKDISAMTGEQPPSSSAPVTQQPRLSQEQCIYDPANQPDDKENSNRLLQNEDLLANVGDAPGQSTLQRRHLSEKCGDEGIEPDMQPDELELGSDDVMAASSTSSSLAPHLAAPLLDVNSRSLPSLTEESPNALPAIVNADGVLLPQPVPPSRTHSSGDSNLMTQSHSSAAVNGNGNGGGPNGKRGLGSLKRNLRRGQSLQQDDLDPNQQLPGGGPRADPDTINNRPIAQSHSALDAPEDPQQPEPPPSWGFSSFRLRATSLGGSLTSSTKNVVGAVSSGATSVVSGTISGTRQAAGAVASGVTTGTKAVVSGTVAGTKAVATGTKQAAGSITSASKAAAGAVMAAPQNIVNMGSGLFQEEPQPGSLHMIDMNDAWFTKPDDHPVDNQPRQQRGISIDVDEEWFTPADPENSAENSDAYHSHAFEIKRQQSVATFEALKVKSAAYREKAQQQRQSRFQCATDMSERPDLFRPVEELLGKRPESDERLVDSRREFADSTSNQEQPSPPELPFYLSVRLNRARRKRRRIRGDDLSSSMEDPQFGNRVKRQFWYTVPRDKADMLYQFLLQWSPDKYGTDKAGTSHEPDDSGQGDKEPTLAEERGFLVIDDEQHRELAAEHEQAPLFGSMLNREWEIVTVEEVRRRLSLSDLTPGNLPLPAGCTASRVLDESKIRQFLEVLPAKAEGYPWRMIYSSFDHGFSLRTLYRKMADFGDEMSPVVILIRDTNMRVFGACVSSPILLVGQNFCGVGDSCFLFTYYPVPARFIPPTSPQSEQAKDKVDMIDELRCYNWTGENQYFVNATSDWLAVGQSSGHYGLWLDADMNRGRTEKCATFNNDPLTGTTDFQLDSIECWGFALDEPPPMTLDGLL